MRGTLSNRRQIVAVSIVVVALVGGGFALHGSRSKQTRNSIVFTIGTQDTTTNTAAAGVVIRQLGLLEKYLPRDGKYAGRTIEVEWENFTSGPPITNGMMANKMQFGVMGDYPLIVNAYKFQKNLESRTQLIAVAAYNMAGSGNGVVVNNESPYFSLDDLKGKVVSVPFGSAAHGMLMRALDQSGRGQHFFQLVNQSPEVGSTNLKEKKIDGHADFVPFPELLPHRGFARKIFDGAETGLPTWHGVIVRTDFAKKYPEIVEAYLRALLEANAWIKADPERAAEKIAAWTGIDKEVVYIYLGPGGIMTPDPAIRPQLIAAAKVDADTLQKLGFIGPLAVEHWVNDAYLRAVFAKAGLDYTAQLMNPIPYELSGTDDFCHAVIAAPRSAGEIWLADGPIKPYASTSCMLRAYDAFAAQKQKIDEAYVFDHQHGIKLFADEAYYAVQTPAEVTAFMLKRDAVAYATRHGAKVMQFDDVLKAIGTGS